MINTCIKKAKIYMEGASDSYREAFPWEVLHVKTQEWVSISQIHMKKKRIFYSGRRALAKC
jgi:hypothetical protein